jgi:ribosomal protein S2
VDNLIIQFTKEQLVKSYLHLGYQKKQVNNRFSFYLLGFYNNISIINLNYTILYLRNFIFTLTNTLLWNKKFLLVNEFNVYPQTGYKLKGNYFVFTKWKPGLLSNFKNQQNYMLSKDRFIPGIPALCFIISIESATRYRDIKEELKRLGVMMYTVVDSNLDCSSFTYFIPSNNKSLNSQLFYLNLLEKVIEKTNKLKVELFYQKTCDLLKYRSLREFIYNKKKLNYIDRLIYLYAKKIKNIFNDPVVDKKLENFKNFLKQRRRKNYFFKKRRLKKFKVINKNKFRFKGKQRLNSWKKN